MVLQHEQDQVHRWASGPGHDFETFVFTPHGLIGHPLVSLASEPVHWMTAHQSTENRRRSSGF